MLQENVSLKALNSFNLEASARWFADVRDPVQLRAALDDSRVAGAPLLVLGGGSNVLFTRDFAGLVLRMSSSGIALVREERSHVWVRAAAGENWHGLVLHCLAHGWNGLENLSLIPGTAGAAPLQNIGAYGVELESVFESLEALDLLTRELVTLDRATCEFGYRDSLFKRAGRGRYVILSITLRLSRDAAVNTSYRDVALELSAMGINQPTPQQVSDAVVAIRRRKLPDPAVIGNAGSFFKNPIVSRVALDKLLQAYPGMPNYLHGDAQAKLAAAWLIDQCGWKGQGKGGAGVHDQQALVLVNRGEATGVEVLALAHEIQADVLHKFGIGLEAEPVIL